MVSLASRDFSPFSLLIGLISAICPLNIGLSFAIFCFIFPPSVRPIPRTTAWQPFCSVNVFIPFWTLFFLFLVLPLLCFSHYRCKNWARAYHLFSLWYLVWSINSFKYYGIGSLMLRFFYDFLVILWLEPTCLVQSLVPLERWQVWILASSFVILNPL